MKKILNLSGLTLLILSSHAFALDRNNNQMCDIWETRYATGNIDPSQDEDQDGITNIKESIAGSNPFDSSNYFRVSEFKPRVGGNIKVSSMIGKSYRLLSAPSPAGPWSTVGNPIIASSLEVEFPAPGPTQSSLFYRVEVSDNDSDQDGLSNWAEQQLEGFDPHNPNSFGTGTTQTDLAFAETWLENLNSQDFLVSSSLANAYEKDSSNAVLTISRPAPYDQPFTVFLRSAPPSSPSVGVASSGDFQLKAASGTLIAHRFVIPAGQASADLLIEATSDIQVEVPEEVRYYIGGSTKLLEGKVCDARPIDSNVKLLVAYLSPRLGINSLGSGLASIRLTGDNSSSIVAVSFSNLNSLTTSVQIENTSSSNILSIPPTTYNGRTWDIKATSTYTSDQQVLDALLSGNFLLNIYSENASSGEITGFFQAVNGSTAFQNPPSPDPIQPTSGDALDREIVRFLNQATFGTRYEDILAMRQRVNAHGGDRIAAFEEWIDEQIILPTPSHKSMALAEFDLRKSLDPNSDLKQIGRQIAWWTIALNSPDQLRQRMTFALSQIFVISEDDPALNRMGLAIASYYEMLQNNAFGRYRDLLEDVTLNPNMGQYLSHIRNQKSQVVNGVVVASPDENYAREIMQLFSIGLVKLHPDGSLILGANGLPIPTYNQEDITEVAKVFTGWSFSKKAENPFSSIVVDNNNFFQASRFEEQSILWSHPMKLFSEYHDETAKNFMGFSIPTRVGGGTQDLDDTLDILANHSNTAAFISRQLIQRFTTSNPSLGYTYRVSNAFTQSGGDFIAVLKAILLDPEARNPDIAYSSVGSGKVKEPIIVHTSWLRALNAKSDLPVSLFESFGYPSTETAKFPPNTRMARYTETSPSISQDPVGAPSVFNWYRPDYAPSGSLSENGLSSPEFQIANETTTISAMNFQYDVIDNDVGQSTKSLPSGHTITSPTTGILYDEKADNMIPDLAQFRELYLSVLDTTNDGEFSNTDSTWVNRATLIPQAIELVLDRADLLLCAGAMKVRYGNTQGTPRHIILEAVKSIESQNNDKTTAISQTRSMNYRIRDTLDLVSKSPDFIIQK